MTIDPQFLDELRRRVPVSQIVGKRVKLVRKGREFAGLCPFHSEKTPSFTVNDDKAFYHCFGCGAHGDIVRFVSETEGLTFPEAVAQLAAAAGMTVPQPTAAERRRSERAKSLHEACAAALRFFRRRLEAAEGAAARAYLKRRGLKPETVEAFGLGWAPEGRSAAKQALTGEGFPEAMLIEAGLLVAPEGGGASYDRFRGRVIFPIADRRGRTVAFGGRALGDIQPKYLNSPETPLFNKGQLLYGLDKARQAVRDGAAAIVTEGYTDVLALHQAGFAGAVAPLGTALTESQIEELWRVAPEPVLCFDGDAAGRRAADRALDRLLPRLTPDRTARFAFLPEGEDPDSFVSLAGPSAFGRLVDRALPVSQALWRRVVGTQTVQSPEAALIVRRNIEAAVAQMAERDVQVHYRTFLNNQLWALIRQRRGGKDRPGPIEMKADIGPEANVANRLKAVAAALVNHPGLLRRYGERLVAAGALAPELAALLTDALELSDEAGESDAGESDAAELKALLAARGHGAVLEKICNRKLYAIAPFADPAQDAAAAEVALADALRRQDLGAAAAELQQQLKHGRYREDEAEYARLSRFAADIARRAGETGEADL